ncbi:CheY-like chemotaxis protein, response regulator receiver [Psychromonas sp. CNPT3]|uniref:response regulator n=1 Tax=Psychromonas sp. CNPT3 TaxID=314282 RepID=UPI00006E916F|nr:response regulator [Psychromonas sp. CNPT3]AGH81306.1 CheY-like chemotaxis protein, response regulator receiver [Psychromonas sp. CNPT3]
MEKINIICVDDDREVLDSVLRDLDYFSDFVNLEACESAFECLELLEELDANQEHVAVLISDHVMPGKSGVDLLIDVEEDPRFIGTKKLLLTGLATQADTIRAINNARIDYFLEKVWDPEELLQTVKELLTTYVVEKGLDYETYADKLDARTLSRFAI